MEPPEHGATPGEASPKEGSEPPSPKRAEAGDKATSADGADLAQTDDESKGREGDRDMPASRKAGKDHFSVSNIISAVALLVSISVAGYTGWTEARKSLSDARQSLTQTLDKITDIDRQFAEFQSSGVSEADKAFASFTFANRKMVLLRAAEDLFEDLGSYTTPEDAAVISVAYYGVGEFEKAERHLSNYMKSADSMIERVVALRSLANLALVQGDHDAASNYLDQAIAEVKDAPNDAILNALLDVRLFQVQHAVAKNDYDKALLAVGEMFDASRRFLCSPGRGNWLRQAISLHTQIAPRASAQVLSEVGSRVNVAGDCIYDPGISASPGPEGKLGPMTGAYVWNGQRLRVFLWDADTLALAVPGQPVYMLNAQDSELHYSIDGLPGFSIEFQGATASGAEYIRMDQPEGKTLWKRAD